MKAFYEVESITLDSNEGKLTVGNSHTIKATVAPDEVAAETTIEWSSSNEKVATVDSNGKVTAVFSGNATITATAGEESANYEVTVEQPKKTTTSNKTYTNSGSGNSSAAVTPSNQTPVAPVTPSAPTTPVQPSNPEPAAPAPAQPSNPEPAQPSNPEPAQPSNPEPAQPSQPSGGDSNTDWWFCRLTKHQNHYFRNSDKSFYAAGFDDEGKSMNPSDEYIPFVPDILYDDDGIGYLCLMQPSWLHTIDDIRHKIDGILATDKKIREHDEYYVGSLRNDIISYELVQRVE